MLLSSTTVNGAVSNDSNNNITMSVGNNVIANVNSSGIYFESGKKAIYTGAVLQVASVVKTDTFTTTSTSYVDVTGLSVSITPSSSSNKILVLFQISGSQNVAAGRAYVKLLRDSTGINLGASAGSRTPALGGFSSPDNSIPSAPVSGNFLDSPATTSSVTYKVQLAMTAGAGSAYINQTQQDADSSNQLRMASTITVMEIAG